MAFLAFAARAGAAMAFCSVATPVFAETEPSAAELASARSLFNEARAAEERGDWVEALARLDAVAKVKMTPQVRFHLGLCQEHTTQLVEALNNLERAASEGTEQNLPTVAAEAKNHAESVRARLPRLSIVMPAGTEARVEVDGRSVASVLLDRPMAFDPGAHKIIATSPGLVFSRDLSVGEGEEKRIDVVFSRAPSPALADRDAPAVPPLPSSAPAGPEVDSEVRSSTLAWVAVGVGGAALAGALGTALARQGALDEIDRGCPSHQGCPRSLESSQSQARTFGVVTAVLATVGVVSAATGVVMLLQSRPRTGTAELRLGPWVGANGAGATGAVVW